MKGIRCIQISFPEPVEITDEEARVLNEIALRACKRYEKAHPDRVMWPAGVGSMPLNIWTASDDEPIEFDDATFVIDCSERERYEWPCAKCGHEQGDHQGLILDPPAGDCVYEPMKRA